MRAPFQILAIPYRKRQKWEFCVFHWADMDQYQFVAGGGEMGETAAQAAPEAVLCLNADDSLIASLSLRCPNPVRFYGVGVSVPQAHDGRSDAPNCVRCGRRYEYGYHTYAHLGGFFCPDCGYSRPAPVMAPRNWAMT